MGRIWMPAGGGGADLDVITASAGDVLAGKVTVDRKGEPLVGTVKDQGNWGFSELAAGSAVTIPEGKHGGGGKVTAKSLASQTPGDSAAGHILAGRTAWVNGSKITGTIPSQAGGTLTPSTSAVTANCSGKYMTSNYTIPAFSLPPANALRKGYSYTLYGKTVTGTLQTFVNTPTDVYQVQNGATAVSGRFFILQFDQTPKNLHFASATRLKSILRFDAAINVTDYKYLKFDVPALYYSNSVSCTLQLGISKSSDGSGIINSSALTIPNNGSGVVILDVSSYSDMYFIYVTSTANGDYNQGGRNCKLTLSNS